MKNNKTKDKEIFFEQYKLYVETAEKVSEKRQNANTYFVSLNSFLIIFLGYLTTISFNIWHLIIAIVGMVICFFWLFILKSYRSLNSAKYKVIHEMEKNLPVKLFDDEWELLERGENKKNYFKLSVMEQYIPLTFIALYLIFFNLMVFF